MIASNRKELQLHQSPQTRFHVVQVEQEEAAESVKIESPQESTTMRRKRSRCLPNSNPNPIMPTTTSSKVTDTVSFHRPIMGTSNRKNNVNDSMNENDRCFGNFQKKRRLALNANNDDLNLKANVSMNQIHNQNSNLVSPERLQVGILVHHNANTKHKASLVSTSSIIISQDSDCENEITENDIYTSIHTQHDPHNYLAVSPFCDTDKPTPTHHPPPAGGIAFELDQCCDSQHSNSPICPSDLHPFISTSMMNTSSNSTHGRTKQKQQSKLPWSSSYSQTTNNDTMGLSLFQKVTSSSRTSHCHTNSNPRQNTFTISDSNNSNINYNINNNSHGGYDYAYAEAINGHTCLTQSVGATTSSAYFSQGRGQQILQLQEISDTSSNFNNDTTIFCHVCERPSICHENNIENRIKNNNSSSSSSSSSNNHNIHCNDTTINTNILIYDNNNSKNYTPKQRLMTANKKQTNSLYNYFSASSKTTKTHVNANTSTCFNSRKNITFKSNASTNHTIATPRSPTSVTINFTNCSYCDRPTCCISCIATCDSCTKSFCKFCYTINYDWIVDRYFCPDCNDCNMASTSSGSSNSNGCSDLMEKMDLS